MTLRVLPTPLKLPPVAVRARAEAAVSAWYGGGEEWEARAARARTGVASDWFAVLEPALRPRHAAGERLHRAAQSGIVVTTGQQAGLFGGPLYTWFKALTALALADELERRLRLPVAPVFWAATDDADLAEATVTEVNVSGGFETIRFHRDVERETPMSAVPVGDISQLLERLLAACGSAPNTAILDLVRQAYRPDNSLGSAYVELLRGVLEPLGVAVLDAAHPATRAAASPVVRSALERANSISARLQERAQEMAALGMRPQVRSTPGRTLVFSLNGTKRQRVRMSEAVAMAGEAHAHDLSPNVLLRPIAERCILPTVAYVGGPAEIAYFAQVSAVADALDVAPPHIVPRWSGFLVEPHVQRALAALGLDVADIADPHAVEGRLARQELPDELRTALSDAREHARHLARRLSSALHATALPLPSAVAQGSAKQLEHKLDRLERRLLAAVKRRGSDRLRMLATARGALYPRDLPQERALNMVPLLARHGQEPLEAVLSAARRYAAEL